MSSESSVEIIVKSWRQGRPIVPFIGAGVSVAAGYPNITRLTDYLAKVHFALDNSIYGSRYPLISDGIDSAAQRYIRRPSEFIADFGWPDYGQLNSDLWSWIANKELNHHKSIHFVKDHAAAVQTMLFRRLKDSEPDVALSLSKQTPRLNGDWSALLNGLSEGQLDLVDALFTGLGKGRSPTRAHLFLAFLTHVLGIKLLLTTNFDSLLESAMIREGLQPKVFDIHRDADLPHARLVKSQLSLIKLAGSAYGLRFGERLQYALEEESRRRLNEYLPDNALIVVIGFSGWERRMMQVIGDFARRQAANSGQTQVLWLTDVPKNGRHSPQLEKLIEELNGRGRSNAVTCQVILDANSFLPGLYFNITSGFPASQQRYDALVSFPPIPEDKKASFASITSSPALVVLSDADPQAMMQIASEPSSWASLAAAHCASEHQSNRHTLWIDLENHYSVESVVQDILSQIRRIDPAAPRLMLPSEPTPVQAKHDLVKAVERIREALQRGRYLLVFDSLESFGRPHFVHHGLPQWIAKHLDSIGQANRLFDLLCRLVGVADGILPLIHPPLHDTLILVSVTSPTTRHVGEKTVAIKKLRHNLEKLLNVRLCDEAVAKIPVRLKARFKRFVFTRDASRGLQCTQETAKHDYARDNVLVALSGLNESNNIAEWVRFAFNVVSLRRALSKAQPTSEIVGQGQIALLSLLSFFRRPRPIALIRAVLLRWSFDPGDLDNSGQVTTALVSIDKAIVALEHDSRIHRLEGGTVWIPRQIIEPVYGQVTSVLKLSYMPHNLGLDAIDDGAVMLLASLLCSTWHLQLARAYFADVYLATHDEQAFFEYMYHRVSAMRYLLLAQAACSSPSGAMKRIKTLEEKLLAMSSEGASLGEEGQTLGSWQPIAEVEDQSPDNMHEVSNIVAKSGCPLVAMLLNGLGVFASVRRDRVLTASLKLLSPDSKADSYPAHMAVDAIRIAVSHSRRHSLQTLSNAFTREHDRISATTSPHTWLGWISQLLEAELPEVAGEWRTLRHITRVDKRFRAVKLREDESASAGFNDAHAALGYNLLELKLRLLRQKLDYSLARETASVEICRLSGIDETYTNELYKCPADRVEGPFADAWAIFDGISSARTPKQHALWRHLIRCWIEYARSLEGQGNADAADKVLRTVIEHVEQRILVPGDDSTGNSAQHILYDARRVSTELQLHKFPMWNIFDRSSNTRRHSHESLSLRKVERYTHELEDAIRVSAPSAVDYATRRSDVYSMRGRALYLRGQFREAHRVLSLSLNDLRDHPDDSRFARAIVHLYRAELQTISADTHLLSGGNPMSSLRKLETALECLDMAAHSLDPAAHHAIWWLRIHLGRAQIRHEQLLLTVRQLSGAEVPGGLGYAQLSLWLEECVLDGLRSLRIALDTLPFNNKVYKKAMKNPDSLVHIEAKLLALWVQLFVASFACNHLMLARLQMAKIVPPQPVLTGWCEYFAWTASVVSELRNNRVNPLCELLSPYGFWKAKWGPWCEMRQFYYFAGAMEDLVKEEEGVIANKIKEIQPYHGVGILDHLYGFREELLSIETSLTSHPCCVHAELWNWRRNECKSHQ